MPVQRVKRTLSLREDTLRMAAEMAEATGVSLSEYVENALRGRLSREGGEALRELYETDPDYRSWCDMVDADARGFVASAETDAA